MPSKLRKAIGAVKDQTSISLAKVTNAANLEVVILKATTHDEIPIEERYVHEIVSLVSSNKVYAAACAQSIGKRIGKTRTWVVALKSLMVILRIFQDGDPYFPREVLHAMKRGTRILNLSGFRDDSSSSPWEFTAFVRLMALYLDERLDCFLTGKLQRRITFKNHHQHPFKNHKMFNDTAGIKDMKPLMLLDKITFWQRLLDRAMGTRPTGEAKTNRLVQISLYAVIQETFDLYRDISDGLSVILDSFFKLPYKACVSAFQACVKSCKQFEELSDFYSFCSSIGVGRSSEYPKVQKISEELMETLQEFLRDQATTSTNINLSNYNHHRAQSSSSSSQYSPLSKHLFVSALRESSGVHYEGYERYGTPESYFETASENASSHCTSLEDLMIATDAGILTPRRFEIDYGDDDQEEDEKQSEKNDDSSSAYESCSNHSYPNDQAAGSSLDLVSLDEVQNEEDKEKHGNNVVSSNNNDTNNNASQDCWELVLAETATSSTKEKAAEDYNNTIDSLFDQSDSVVPHHQYNPFLELDDTTVSPFTNAIDQTQMSLIDIFDGNQNPSESKVMAPTFTAQSAGFDMDLASTFVDLNSNTSYAMPTSSCLEDLAENSLALVPASSQENNHGVNSTSIFHSQGSFKISPTPTYGSKTSIFTSQGSFMTNSASSSQGYELYQTSMVPTFNSQGSFKISSISSFQGDRDAYQMSTRPTFSSQNSFQFGSTSTSQGHDDSYQPSTRPTFTSESSFKRSPTSTSPQGHNSPQMSIIPTFNSQNSFKNGSTSSFQGHDSYWTNTTPTMSSQNSFKINSASSSPRHEPYHSSIAPTFYGHNSYQTSLESTFQGHNSYMMSTTPTSHNTHSYQTSNEQSFQRHTSYQASIEPTFHTHNHNQVSKEPIFQGNNNSFQTSARPIFHGHSSSDQMNSESAFHAYSSYLTSTIPSFYSNDSCKMSKEPIFPTHNSYQTNTIPSFQTHNKYQAASTTPSPTFIVQNNNLSMVEATPTIGARNPNNEAMVQSTSWQQNFLDTMAEPTFRAKLSDEPLLGAPKEDDSFGSLWPSSSLTNNDDALDKSLQKLSLEQQRQSWLEQQKKIIEKHLN